MPAWLDVLSENGQWECRVDPCSTLISDYRPGCHLKSYHDFTRNADWLPAERRPLGSALRLLAGIALGVAASTVAASAEHGEHLERRIRIATMDQADDVVAGQVGRRMRWPPPSWACLAMIGDVPGDATARECPPSSGAAGISRLDRHWHPPRERQKAGTHEGDHLLMGNNRPLSVRCPPLTLAAES